MAPMPIKIKQGNYSSSLSYILVSQSLAIICYPSNSLKGFLASAFRHLDFGLTFGVTLVDGPMRGLLARAVVALDENGTVVHTELVPELTHEPDYDLAIHAIRNRHHPCPEDALESAE